MRVADVVAEILKREGVELIIGYPVNDVLEAAARADIRTVIVRQERVGIHMADAMSRVTSSQRIGVFAMQHGPGTENAFGAVAQAYADSVPVLILPEGYPRPIQNLPPNFSALLNYREIAKWVEQVVLPGEVPNALRRAWTQLKNGRPRPVVIELPRDLVQEEFAGPLDYRPAPRVRIAPDPVAVDEVAAVLVAARRPVIYAGQGVHYAQAWEELRALAELLEAPVCTSLQGKSAFPEDHPLALGAGGRAYPATVAHFLREADVIFGIGCSFTRTNYGVRIPYEGKTIVHATLDSADLNKDVPVTHALLGDAKLTLAALYEAVSERLGGKPRGRLPEVVAEIRRVRDAWLAQWMPKLTSDEVPLTPYRVIWELMHTLDIDRTIITHDAGSPRDQLSPFWVSKRPLTYLGWGKSTQLGYGLGLAMGAKLARPDMLCINVWGDAAIGMTGMDFETAVRERIPILSILFNNFSMAIEIPVMPVATEKYRATDISGDYAAFARAMGGYGERVTEPGQIVPAIQRALRAVEDGIPALLEFITGKELAISTP
jgi:thiamine pyrophosphate-dependent acetolactate synthase large subunit-like protein